MPVRTFIFPWRSFDDKSPNGSGLTESTNRQRRRSADDSILVNFTGMNSIKDNLTEVNNLDQLKDIIRNQRKYNQQLQTRIRLNASDVTQSSMIEKLQEQIHVRIV